MVQLNRNDLDFILRQIKLAEAHTAAIEAGADPRVALEQLVSSPLLPYGLRTVDGSFNNFQPTMTQFGSSDEVMIRLLAPSYGQAEANPRTGQQTSYNSASGSVYDSQPRIISNLVADQSLGNPAAIAAALASVDITGAQALEIVGRVMELQAAARAAHAAVAGAADAAQVAYDAADAVVSTAATSEADAQEALDAATAAQLDAAAAADAAGAALTAAAAALAAHATTLAAAQQTAAEELAESQAAAADVADKLDARNIAQALLAVAVDNAAQALAVFTANPNATNAAAYAAAVEERDDAQLAHAQAEDAHEDAVAALAAAQATHAAAVTALQAATTQQQALLAQLDAAEDGAAAANAGLSSANAALSAAGDALAAASEALADAIAARDAIPTGAAATAVASAAAAAADGAVTAELASHGVTMDGDNVFIRNIAADLGDTASFNSFMTIFGQFFDHGLDLTAKGGSGSVYIPLQPDDPLYVPNSPTNFMVLTRATNDPGADGVLGTADDVRDHRNETTPWIDLNQVYASNASHQVFLREYVLVDNRPMATGEMLEGEAGGPPTWADIKKQAMEVLGIELDDLNVHAVPALLTDLYGEFVRGPNGFPQLVTPSGVLVGNLAAPVDAMQAVSAGRAFLNDIAHDAVPGTYTVGYDAQMRPILAMKQPDEDGETGNAIVPNMYGGSPYYDDEMLDRHFIVGDGRGNENIALTATHSIFHGEHNRQVAAIKATVLAEGDLALLNEWLLVDVAALPADPAGLVWDGERLFQAARFSTEMVYQHLVFEEFVRAITPQIDPFVFSHSVEIDPGIFEEFAQVVYRFGHSMLNENVDMLKLAGNAASAEEVGLIEAFLNPIAFENAGIDAHAASGAIIRGMTRQAGNEIDEFMTSAVRNNLVGLPLDLATINLTRARETGIPSLNEARRQLYEQTHDTYLKPYVSWADFAQNIKNPLSIVNFIAAYGTHEDIAAATTVAAKRDAAWNLVFGVDGETADEREARLDYLNATGAWATQETGLNKVDFWIGGLAEALMPFGGMLGSTFTFIFELQIEKLQNGDRFYYLSRTQGLNLLTALESDSFAELIRRNTDTEETGLHINGAAFQTADYIIEMDQSRQWNAGLGTLDPTREADVLSAITGQSSLVVRRTVDPDNDPSTDNSYRVLHYTGGEHVVLGGTNAGEMLIGGAGDDTIWGEGGDDRIEGGFGVDHLHGGAGDDIITDSGTDVGAADVLKGEAGDDVLNGGMGLDLVFGGDGNDVLSGGSEAKSLFGGEGNDFIRAASGGGGIVYGNEGDDWMEGQGNMNTLTGDNSELFFNSRIIGHDIMLSGENDTDFDAESGDDIMVQGIGINRNNGMAGFDWVAYKGNDYDAVADMNVSIFVNQQNNILRDRFDLVEGLSGWDHNDTLTGREFVIGAYDALGNAAQVDPDAPIESFSNVLLEKNLHLIKDLDKLVAHLQRFDVWNPHNVRVIEGEDDDEVTVEVIDPTKERLVGVMDTSDGSDILLGGGGSDVIRGMAGNDIIDGDRMLDVYIAIKDAAGTVIGRAEGLTSQIRDSAGNLMYQGRTLESLLFSRDIRPSQMEARREIIDGGKAGDIDTAVYWDVVENYGFTRNADGSITVEHVQESDAPADPLTGRNLQNEGVDRLFNIERLRFSDGNGGTVDYDVDDLFNAPPVVTSPAAVSVAENTAAVLTVTAVDADGDTLTYAIAGGADAALFVIDPQTGALSFAAAPNFEAPADAGGNNVYNIDVSASDGRITTTQSLAISVANVNEPTAGAPAITDLTPTETVAISVGTAGIADPDGIVSMTVQWQRSTNGGVAWSNINGATGGSYTPAQADVGAILRAVVTVTDVLGSTVLAAPATGIVGDSWSAVPLVANTFNGTAGDDIANGTDGVFGLGANDTLNGNGGNDILNGAGGNDTINGGEGNDTINGGAGNDTINQTSTHGRDLIDGGAGTDTYRLNGVAGAETFRIYAIAGAQNNALRASLASTLGATFAANTEIVITRTVNDVQSVIAELDNIEEIRINSLDVTANDGGGLNTGTSNGDTVQVFGNFTPTSLAYSTIIIDGTAGDDVIDISTLQSAHRIVFRSNGGNDTIIGTLRPQDVIEIMDGASLADYAASEADGIVTLTNGDHTISFSSAGAPEIRASTGTSHDDDECEHDDDDNDDDDDDDTDAGAPAPAVARTLTGTAQADVLTGGAAGDILLGGGGNDILSGDAGNDTLRGEDGDDVISGGDGADVASGGEGHDEIHGGNGRDMLFGNAGDDLLFGDGGGDVIEGGAGADRVWAGDGDDTILATVGDGNDTYWGDEGSDTLDYAAAASNLTVDLGNGFMGRGSVSGTDVGIDTIYGFENFIGGSGHDVITASAAVNIIDGGLGDDVFRFTSTGAAHGDTIYGFSPGDRIDFSAIDANSGQAGTQGFTLMAGSTLSGAGQVVVTHEQRDGADVTVIRGSIDAGPDADFELTLMGTHNLRAADFNGVS